MTLRGFAARTAAHLRHSEGQAMAEYGLVLALVAVALITVLQTSAGQALLDVFQKVLTSFPH